MRVSFAATIGPARDPERNLAPKTDGPFANIAAACRNVVMVLVLIRGVTRVDSRGFELLGRIPGRSPVGDTTPQTGA